MVHAIVQRCSCAPRISKYTPGMSSGVSVGRVMFVLLSVLIAAACTSSNGSTPGDQQCTWPAALNDAGPGACGVARALLYCSYPSGAGCSCLSDDPTTCPGCGPSTGATCTSKCAANEYATSCGGPPSSNVTYQGLPASCHSVGGTPGGNLYGCCPCE